jgi:hypothetical protein
MHARVLLQEIRHRLDALLNAVTDDQQQKAPAAEIPTDGVHKARFVQVGAITASPTIQRLFG